MLVKSFTRRIAQFFIIYGIGLASLLVLKYFLALSDYVVPGIPLILETAKEVIADYIPAVFSTLDN